MTLQATVSMSWVHTVLGAAQQLGVARNEVLAAAGLSAADLQAERWPIDHITRLWRAAVLCTQDAGFGLKAGAGVGPASFNLVGDLLQTAPSLRASIALAQQYQRLISDGGRFQMIAGDAATWLVYHPRQGALAFSPHQIEAVLAAVVTFSRWVTAQPLRPRAVQFSQPRIGPLQGYRDAFQCPVGFEQAFSGVMLDNAVLDAALPQADAQRARMQQQVASARLAALSSLAAPEALERHLREWIADRLGAGLPSRAQAARAVQLSERTLARRLQARGLDYSALLDAARRESALAAVAEGSHPLAEVGLSLGFAEPSTFWRAFQRWTGQTPAQWRRLARSAYTAPT